MHLQTPRADGPPTTEEADMPQSIWYLRSAGMRRADTAGRTSEGPSLAHVMMRW
jgi:hypothetical protein